MRPVGKPIYSILEGEVELVLLLDVLTDAHRVEPLHVRHAVEEEDALGLARLHPEG